MKINFFKKMGIILVLVSMFVFFLSCDPDDPGSSGNIGDYYPKISSTGWTFENIDSSYWSSSFEPSAFINIYIKFEESELTAGYLESVSITPPVGNSWSISDVEKLVSYFDAETSILQAPRLYSTYYQSNGSVLAIGDYLIEVIYTNGDAVSTTLTVPAPGALSTNSNTYVYTEDYPSASTPPSGYTALPKRATITAATVDTLNSEVEITFSVNDSNIYNASVWFYNSSGNYVGSTDWLRDFSTGTLSSKLNDGSSFNTDGASNTITASFSDLYLESGYSGSDIASLHIMLTDGKQYISSDIDGYDSRSISAEYTAD